MKLKDTLCLAWAHAWRVLAVAAACGLSTLAAQADDIYFRGQKITYSGATLKWIGDPTSKDSELIFIYKDAENPGTFAPSAGVEARVIAIGGGGAGGTVRSTGYSSHAGGGGGGAGEFLDRKGFSINKGAYQIVVGKGGAASTVMTAATVGEPGKPTAILDASDNPIFLVNGGGGGGAESLGGDGGSGGGGSYASATTAGGGASSCNNADGIGHAGGGSVNRYAGGGGGAKEDGTSGSGSGASGTSGTGGAGITIDDLVPDMVLTIGGGGGGGSTYKSTGGAGGEGGGGRGAGATNTDAAMAEPGDPNTGSGGGGGGRYKPGANGGSGIIIIRLTFIEQPINWKAHTVTVSGRTGTFYVDERAEVAKDGSDYVITYKNVDFQGGLRVGDAEHPMWAKGWIMAVGGGGGGGFIDQRSGGAGGGGGAGGVTERKDVIFDSTMTNLVVVGKGGRGGSTNEEAGASGASSSVKCEGSALVDEALGGGGGGAHTAGADGGSGGGGSRTNDDHGTGIFDRAGGDGTAGQGFAGGSGKTTFVGGGGGGAGGAGEDSSGEKGGDGGQGVSSAITGTEVWYAGGGGGAYVNGTSGTMHLGGAGGKGGGGRGAGNDGTANLAAGNGVDGLGGGGGGGTSHAGGTTPAGNGGSGVVIIRLSAFVVERVELPPIVDNLVYNGEVQVASTRFDTWAYTMTGTWEATNSDWYEFTLTRTAAAPMWWDGTTDPKTVRWRIKPMPVGVPAVLPEYAQEPFAKFTGDPQTAVHAVDDEKTNGGVDADGFCWTNGLKFCQLVDHVKVDAGTFTFTAKLVNDYTSTPNVTNFIWTSESVADRTRTWTIEQADNEIVGLTVPAWEESDTTKVPTITGWTWKSVAETYPGEPDTVVYTYAKAKRQPTRDDEYTIKERPTTPGVYWVHAYICKDSKHEPGNWVEAHAYARLVVWRHPSKTLTDFVNIEIASGKSEVNLPVLVRLREWDGQKGIPGFTYDRAGSDGSKIRFLQLGVNDYQKPDADRDQSGDELLAYEIEKWDPYGESLVWVRVNPSELKAAAPKGSFRLYWHNEGEPLVEDFEPREVWKDYAGVWHMNEEITAETAHRTLSADASGNELHATPTQGTAATSDVSQMVSIDGKIGRARVNSSVASVTHGNALRTARPVTDLNSTFTFSGWFRMNAAGGYPRLVGSLPSSLGNGWSIEMQQNSTTRIMLRASGGDGNRYTINTDIGQFKDNWVHLTVSYDGTKAAVYGNGVSKFTKSDSVRIIDNEELPLAFGSNGDGSEYSLNGAYDELRLKRGAISAAWAKAEYDMVNSEKFCTFGLVNRPVSEDSDEREWVDYWTTEPSLKHYWDVEAPPTVANLNAGKGALGSVSMGLGRAVTYVCRKTPSKEPVTGAPTEEGTYEVEYFGTPEKDLFNTRFGYLDGTRVFEIEIIGKKPTPIIDPAGPTESGRVLLANDDTNATAPVTDQSAWKWQRLDAEDGGGLVLSNSTRKIWRLTNVEIGNLFSEDGSLTNRYNTLPWSTTAKNTKTESLYDAPQKTTEIGQLVMKNVHHAMIESGLYTNGIGTIYFDVVNAWTNAPAAALNLEVLITTDDIDADNRGWEDPLTMYPVQVNGKTSTPQTATTELGGLNLANGGVTNNFKFYRVYVPVNTQVPTRFCIRRTSTLSTTQVITPADPGDPDDPDDDVEEVSVTSTDPENADGFILIDNVIASFPMAMPTLVPYGTYDPTRTGKAVLGVETAFTTDYPAVGDSVKGRVALAGGDPETVTDLRLRYRWRYLNSAFNPIRAGGRDVWKVATFDLAGGRELLTREPLELGSEPGDIEYYYDMTVVAPYYTYVDYTGLDVGVKKREGSKIVDYTERVTPEAPYELHAPAPKNLFPSGGTNWFVRLREFPSATRGYTVIAKSATNEESVVQRFDMTYVATNVWRGLVPTTKATGFTTGEVFVRFERETPVNPGSTNLVFETTSLAGGEGTLTLPKSLTLAEATTNDWTRVPCEGVTGYLMFQYDESTRTLSITRADYQDFNRWNDANTMDDRFVGTSMLDEKKSGVSRDMRDYVETFAGWTDIPSAKPGFWRESFTVGSGTFSQQYPVGVLFREERTPNSWFAVNGMWVNEKYQLDDVNGAFQMRGCGEGSLEFRGASSDPRGLESLTFSARLAQTIEWNDIAWKNENVYDNANYAFGVQVAMSDTFAPDLDFDGAAQASVFACYQPNVGAYEFRVTCLSTAQIKRELIKWSVTSGLPKPKVIRADIVSNTDMNMYRKWHKAATDPPSYPMLYISVEPSDSGTVKIQAGYSTNHATDGANSTGWRSLGYWDNSNPYTWGTYGVASANCRAVFVSPRKFGSHVNWVGGNNAKGTHWSSNAAITFPADVTFEKNTETTTTWRRRWVTQANRMTTKEWADRWGFQAEAQAQTVVFQWRAKVTDPWQTLRNYTVSGFSLGSPIAQDDTFWRVEDGYYRLTHGGDQDDARIDIVIDGVELKQWRGDDYGGKDASEYVDENMSFYGWPTNVVFTSGWVNDEKVKLSAKRTKPGQPCSVRSPLMDGREGRGLGLGMISVDYANAQENVNLLVQVATNEANNIGKDNVVNLTKSIDSALWTTVTNFDFRAFTREERRAGTLNVYLGLHGKRGLMRVIMDPEVVKAVADETDTTRFGEIDITRVVCRDEPQLDETSWWGWNIRTFGWSSPHSRWDNGDRSYLPDGPAPGDNGLSLALNHSTTEDVRPGEEAVYAEHMPFVQTPTFATNIVGEVSFRARMFSRIDAAQKAEIRVYGASKGGKQLTDEEWGDPIASFVISNTAYRTYTFRSPNSSYHAFRFAVTGVEGVAPDVRGPAPTQGPTPVRVMIDEIVVTEALYPTVGFRYIYPVRTGVTDNQMSAAVIEGVAGAFRPNPDEQPLLGENWTFQAEVEAKQLPEEVDFDTPGREPRVFVQWFKGRRPWGYDKWKASARTPVELLPAEGQKLVFRGSLPTAPDAVVDDDSEAEGTIFQYMASVIYFDKNGAERTNSLERVDWKRPTWYDPIDYNAKESSFAAFTILDSVSPGRVWINEVNVYDGKDDLNFMPAIENQYVEIAVPAGVELEGWRLDYIDEYFATNTLCTFGKSSGSVSTAKRTNETNDYVFVVVQSPKTESKKTWAGVTRPDGTPVEIDGTWRDFGGHGELKQELPIALRLIRSSQVVEQEIVLEGKNMRANGIHRDEYSLETYVKKFNATGPMTHYYGVGNEANNDATKLKLEGQSLGVFRATGLSSNDWNNVMHQTPGWCNEGQIVPENWVIYPNGALIMITARLGDNRLVQAIGDGAFTNGTVKVTAPKGGDGTNIVYAVDAWYELASVTTNNQEIAIGESTFGPDGKRRYVVTVGKGLSNNVSVVATTAPWKDLAAKYGLDEKNKYTPAVMDWLVKGKNYFDESFKKPGEINLGEYRNLAGVKVADLSLTDMYWLDMDPTEGNWWFQAGVTAVAPVEKPVAKAAFFAIEPPEPEQPALTTNNQNLRVTLKMQMTNTASQVVYAPYILRGLEPGSTSQQNYEEGDDRWNAVTLKITGDLQNNNPNRVRWIPLRWFYFLPNALAPNRSASFDADNKAVVDVWDPFDPKGSGMTSGWEDYKGTPVFYSWAIDGRNMPTTVEALAPNSTF